MLLKGFLFFVWQHILLQKKQKMSVNMEKRRKITLQGSFELFCLHVFVSFLRWKITLQSSFEHFWLFILFFLNFYVAESLYRARLSTCALLLYFLICFTLDNLSTELVWALLPCYVFFCFFCVGESLCRARLSTFALRFSFAFLFPSQVRAASTEVFLGLVQV